MSEVLHFKTKKDFLAYCEKIWNDGLKNNYQLIKAHTEPTNFTVVEKRKALKIRANIYLTNDLFERKKTVHPIFKSVCFTFVAVLQENLVDSLKVIEPIVVEEAK